MILLSLIYLAGYKPKNIDSYYYWTMFELLFDAVGIVYVVGVVVFGV